MRAIQHPTIDAIELVDVMYALSDPARLAIVRDLAGARRPLTCGELTSARPKSSMSHHFKILRAAGLVRTEVVGNEHRNRLRRRELGGRFPGLLRAVLRASTRSR